MNQFFTSTNFGRLSDDFRIFFAVWGFANVCYLCPELLIIVLIMAVIKSILLGTARKSISDVNFYKTKGVQIARSKPSIPPSYQPSAAQELQRYKMGFAQYVLNQADWKSFAWMLNLKNVRKKNAASPTNRMISKLLSGSEKYITATNVEYYDTLKKWGGELLNEASSGGDVFPDIDIEISNPSRPSFPYYGIGLRDFGGTIKSTLQTLSLNISNLIIFGYMCPCLSADPSSIYFPATIYPCSIENETSGSSYTDYLCRPVVGKVNDSGIMTYPELKDLDLVDICLYIAIVNNPIGDKVITDGTPIIYSNNVITQY